MDTDFQLILVDPNRALCEAWQREFAGTGVEVVNGRFEELPEYDCMVNAGNSFGLMDGGVDLAIAQYFGPFVVENVQRLIREHYSGEQPVGTSFISPTNHGRHPWLAHTPTMRVPMSIAKTDAVYRAMLAMLQTVRAFNDWEITRARLHRVACPGLGTATGKVSPSSAAAQMALAYQAVREPGPTTWATAVARQRAIDAAVAL